VHELIEMVSRFYTHHPGGPIITNTPEAVSALSSGARVHGDPLGTLTADVA
jgi:2-keto-4-pentenoate hydratase/2-oxohepta-3-ene-1,7-dioic acid hydratase in catechol pathway